MDPQRLKRRVAATSVVAAVVLTSTKILVGVLTNSLGILSEAAHSGLDLVAAAVTLLAVRTSARPADQDHPYGHEKIDNLAALVETLLLLATCVWIVYEALHRLLVRPAEVTVTFWSFAVVIFAIVIDIGRSRALMRVARATHSSALEADALHFSSDVASSLVVLAGLVFTHFGYPQADAVGALGVSLVIVWVSFRLGRKAIDALLDRVPEDHPALAREAALAVPGVEDVYDVRVRHAGAKHFVDLKVAVAPDTPIGDAHALTEEIEVAVRRVLQDADVLVHAEPGARPPSA